MRFFRVIAFILMLVFSYSTIAQTDFSALQVNNQVSFTGNISGQTGTSSGDSTWGTIGAVAGGVAVAGALAATGVGLPLAAVVGLFTYLTLRPSECSFDKILAAFKSLAGGSWLSPVFNMIFNASNQLTTSVNNQLGGTVITILSVMLLFYLLFTATKYIVSFSPIEPAKFFSEIFFPLGRCILAVWAIKNWNYIFTNWLSPVLNLAILFGVKVMESMNTATTSYVGNTQSGIEIVKGTCTVVNEGQGLQRDVCDSIQTFLGTISSSLLVWMAFGATLLTDCWGQGWKGILPSFRMLIIGLLLFVFTFMIYIAFPLKLLDAMFRLMFITVLFPLWCMFWVIPQTQRYCKKMIELLINVLATFLSASIILVMIISILANLFDGIPLQEVIQLLQDDKADEAMDKIGFSTSGLFYSLCLLYMSFHLVSKVDYFANIFSKQESLGMGSGKGSLGAAVTATIASTPQAFRMGKNAMKWGAGKVKGAANRVSNWGRAQDYNASVPGGTKRQSPRLFTNPVTEFIDGRKAKKSIGGYARTRDVTVGKLETARDGSTSQTYSNTTQDKYGNVMARMNETATSNADRSKQSVNRDVTRYADDGTTRQTANVKKDFENGQAVRKTTTRTDKFGNRVELSVDRRTGLATKTRFGADGRKLSSETRNRSGERVLQTYGPDGSVINTERRGPDGRPMP